MTESIFTTQLPTSIGNTESTYTLGTVFKSDVDGQILGIRYYSGGSGTTTNTVALYERISNTVGTLLASKVGGATAVVGWETILFDTPVDIVADQLYVASWLTYNYAVTGGFFNGGHSETNGHLTAVTDTTGVANGKFHDGAALTYPDNTFGSNCYFVDVIFEPAGAPASLTVANGQQMQTVSSPTLTQNHVLAPANAVQQQAASSPSLTQTHILTVQNAAQAEAVQNVTLGLGTTTLVVQNAHQSQRASTVAFRSVDSKRLELHELLLELSESGNVYFQPPSNVKMQYPCIVYSRDAARTEFAGNSPYRFTKRYQVTVIDRNPDSPIPDKVARLPMCTYQRFFTADNLNHDIFDLYF